ncbi:MAG: hypothetical protein GX971_09155 [Firmicutes bacterium]|nr:hypothetical protein [Bacillota bacterium]
MKNVPLDFASQGRYIGSLEKDNQLCDFYEVVVDGNIRYIYVPVGSDQKPDKSG